MDGPSTPRDASEADVAEQHVPATRDDEDDGDEPIPTDSIPADVPEADAIEQAQTVPVDEDETPDS